MTGRAGVTFGVLGPLEAEDERGPVVLKGPRQRAVLARLLIAGGRVVPVERLVDDLWAAPPDGAVGAIQTFVSDLRRALEPDRPPRQPARLLVTAAPGYALRAAPGAVDAQRFERAVGEAGELLASGRPAEALSRLDPALALWRGPAYAEFGEEPWARGEIGRLDGLRMLAVERRAAALLDLGRSAEAASGLEAHVAAHPLREDAWELLAKSLYRSGRQGDALAALRRARETLVSELGVDPGPGLRAVEADILAQAPHLAAPAPPVRPVRPGAAPAPAPAPPDDAPFVGRAEELARMEEAAEAAAGRAGGGPSFVLVSGEAGAGKTALATALTERLAARGWLTAWGRSPEVPSADPPWDQIAAALAPRLGPEASEASAAVPDEDPAAARLAAHRAAAERLARAGALGPVLLVFDDLHQAGEGTLDLLAALATAPAVGPVLIVGTYRTTDVPAPLAATLARLARTEPARVHVGGLPESATGELAAALARRPVDEATTRLIHRRTGGNPFFVRELARLFDAEGGAALTAVPPGVRDVIRHRLARLPDEARTVLRQAAVVGEEIDTDVLIALNGDEERTLDAVETALAAGFLAGEGRRFSHALVRDTLYGDIARPRRARWHAAVAEALERLRPDDATALAHHFARAESRSTEDRAAHYARLAAEQAERRFAPHEAARLWRQAADHLTDPRERLEAVMGLVRALAVTGHLGDARALRGEAVATAERLGDPELAAEVITAFDVPANWTRNDDQALSDQVVQAVERTLPALPAARRAPRSRLLTTLALELRGSTGDRGRRAALEAERIARDLGDPALLAFALDGRFMHTFQRTGLAPERARIAAELIDVASREHLVVFEVLGHLIGLQARSALGDLAAADAHAADADRLAERYDLPLVGVFTQWYGALRLAIGGGDAEAAEAAYRAAAARLAGSGMPGIHEGLLPLALLCLRLTHGRPPPPDQDWGPYEPWVTPLLLLAEDRRADAAVAAQAVPESPHDLLTELRLCLSARTAMALDDRPAMERVHAALLPAANELAGAATGMVTLGPVARTLGDLAAALDRPDQAAEHRRQADAVAGRARPPAGAPR